MVKQNNALIITTRDTSLLHDTLSQRKEKVWSEAENGEPTGVQGSRAPCPFETDATLKRF